MTDLEKKEIIEEVKADIIESLKGKCIKEDTQKALKEPRNKWFKNQISKGNTSPMMEQFGVVAYWQVWENIRKLTCLICGVGYVRQLDGDMNASDIAEKLCHFVFNLRLDKVESEE